MMLEYICVVIKARAVRFIYLSERRYWRGGRGGEGGLLKQKGESKALRLELALEDYLDEKELLMMKLDQMSG